MKQGILVAILVTVMIVFICRLFKKTAAACRKQPVYTGSKLPDDGFGLPPVGNGLLISRLTW